MENHESQSPMSTQEEAYVPLFLDRNEEPEHEPEPKPKYWLHLLLFVVTLVTTTLAGAEMFSPQNGMAAQTFTLTWDQFATGFAFSIPFLGILTVHEFGHYFTARRYGAKVTLPYYIPVWLGWLGAISIGTMGAFIRILSPIRKREQLFDVGAAGPLAGFVAIIGVLVYGYTHLPVPDYIFTIHPEYLSFGPDYARYVYEGMRGQGMLMAINGNLTTHFLSDWLADPARIPNPYEVMHYPVLFAGHMALFFTALNLLPIGQLDGGHILYGLVGQKWHTRLSPIFFVALVLYSGLGVPQTFMDGGTDDILDKLQWDALYLGFLYLTFSKTVEGYKNILLLAVSVFGVQYLLAAFAPSVHGFQGWLIFSFVLGRILGIYHPPTLYDEPMSVSRKIIGLISILVFILSFSPQPFSID